jgi:hypothetical protein
MATELDDLQQVFRAIARDDATDAERCAPRIEAQLTAEWRASRRAGRRPGAVSRAVGFAIAASLVAGLAAQVWMVARRTQSAGVGDRTAQVPLPAEITTAFMPLAYSTVPFVEARLVRLEVPRAALVEFGLAPVETMEINKADNNRTDTVLADVLVGEDGLARAVRFVRAPRAQGVAP